jgi:hypothetical protein
MALTSRKFPEEGMKWVREHHRRLGIRRMLSMTPEERRAFAKLGSDTRWGKIPQKDQKRAS